MPNVYCPFCGVIMLSDPHSDDPEIPLSQRRAWYTEVRGVYAPRGDDVVRLTGLGIICRRDFLWAPLESSISYFETSLEELEEWKVFRGSDNLWGFAFHDSCWNLLLLRIHNAQKDSHQSELDIARSIFHQFDCVPCFEYSTLQFGHDYEGAKQTQRSRGRPETIDMNSHFYTDPCAIPLPQNLEAIPLNHWKLCSGFESHAHYGLDAGFSNSDFPSTHSGVTRHPPSFFERLTTEIKLEICSYVSFHDILNLRLVELHLALFADLNTLPQAYWRSRFCLGNEMDFLFPRLTENRNWFRLFWGVKISLQKGIPSLTNRRRIRELLEHIVAVTELEYSLKHGPHGFPLRPLQNEKCFHLLFEEQWSESTLQNIQILESFSGQISPNTKHEPLKEGCRTFHHRAQSLNIMLHDDFQCIAISKIKIGTCLFIAGIDFFSGVDGNSTKNTLGYCIPESRELIRGSVLSNLHRICVAFRSEGLTGIKFCYQDSSSSGWIGDTTSKEVAFGTLTPQINAENFMISGLDHYKITSLGLGIKNDESDLPPLDETSAIQCCLWTNYPPEEDSCITELVPSSSPRDFDPLVNIDFGGPQSLHVMDLARLIFHIISNDSPIVGIETFFFDGRTQLFGSRGGCEISFFVNGDKGERITQVHIFEGESHDFVPENTLRGLQLSTNWGRQVACAPIRSRLYSSTKPIPTPSGRIITGLVGAGYTSSGYFTRFGIKSQPNTKQPDTDASSAYRDSHVPQEQLEYDEIFSQFIGSMARGSYQTYASLQNVSRITASIGIQGRSRSSNRITGLKVEYFDSSHVDVLGQWMHERDEVFELSRGEKFQSLTIWYAPAGQTFETRGLELGQVIGISAWTSHFRKMTFCSPHLGPSPQERIQDQFQCDFGDEMVAISWLMSPFYDRIRAVIPTYQSRPDQILVPDVSPPFDQVEKLYFENRQRHGFEKDIAVKAEAYFYDRQIIGIKLTYTSGESAEIGSFDGTHSKEIQFPRHSSVVGFSIATEGNELREFEFEFGSRDSPISTKLKLSSTRSPDPNITQPEPESNDTYVSRQIWDPASRAEEHLQPNERGIYRAPSNARLVGIYVLCQWWFWHGGGIYELDNTHGI